MKVIGMAYGAKLLIEAYDSEIGKLFGATDHEWANIKHRHQRPIYGSDQPSIVGLEINVDNAYAQLAWLRRRNAEFNELIQRLRATATAIEDSRPLFNFVVADGEKTA